MNAQQSVSTTEQAAAPPSSESWASRKCQLWVWTLVLVVVVLLAAVTRTCTDAAVVQSSSRGATGPVPVTTATATVGDLSIYLDAIGTVTPVYTDTITAHANRTNGSCRQSD